MRKFYLLFLSGLFFLPGTFAQTLINPNTDGGFESGGTFAANNWNVVNSLTGTNLWEVGTATAKNGANSAYISNDNGTTNAYDNNTAGISHFYRDVVIPAGATNLTLSFNLRSNGELGTDFLQVYADPTLPTLTPDVSLGASSTRIFFQNALNGLYNVSNRKFILINNRVDLPVYFFLGK